MTTITVNIQPSSVGIGGVVTLTATVNDPPSDYPKGYRIDWTAGGIPLPGLQIDPTDFTKATWETTDLLVGNYTVQARLIDPEWLITGQGS
jgi:hypothetical protein